MYTFHVNGTEYYGITVPASSRMKICERHTDKQIAFYQPTNQSWSSGHTNGQWLYVADDIDSQLLDALEPMVFNALEKRSKAIMSHNQSIFEIKNKDGSISKRDYGFYLDTVFNEGDNGTIH